YDTTPDNTSVISLTLAAAPTVTSRHQLCPCVLLSCHLSFDSAWRDTQFSAISTYFCSCARTMTTSYDLGALKQPDEIGAGRDPRDIILPQPGFKTVLANRDFRLIWSAQVASQLADKFLMFALLILTYSISRASTHGAALFLAYTFPSVFLSPLAGVYADRHDKKRLMFFTNAIRGGLILLIPLSQLVPYFEHVTWHLFLIIFLFAAVDQIFAPAEAAAIPFIVGSEELMTATSMFTSTVIVTLLVA